MTYLYVSDFSLRALFVLGMKYFTDKDKKFTC